MIEKTTPEQDLELFVQKVQEAMKETGCQFKVIATYDSTTGWASQIVPIKVVQEKEK